MFKDGSQIKNTWLGFCKYPDNAISAETFQTPSFPCLIICSTATDYSKKVVFLWNRKNPHYWFAKIILLTDVNKFDTRFQMGETFLSSRIV